MLTIYQPPQLFMLYIMLLLAPIFILLYLRSKKKLKLNSKRLIVVVTGNITKVYCQLIIIFEKFKWKDDKYKRKNIYTIMKWIGCDSGFGLTTTEILSKLGFQVVAACLTKKGIS